MERLINPGFIFNQIRRYNQARKQTYKDAALVAVGIHVGLLEKKNIVLRDLSEEQRRMMIYFLQQFCCNEGVNVTIK
ncbi:hypothetical protein [Funiculus sociatus]|uniref:hypothetical protein n=1 Tax=Funiculus sociatus TaxID=450527 RepID=UPI003299FF9E